MRDIGDPAELRAVMERARLRKARATKYKRRWRGKDGKWKYDYGKRKRPKIPSVQSAPPWQRARVMLERGMSDAAVLKRMRKDHPERGSDVFRDIAAARRDLKTFPSGKMTTLRSFQQAQPGDTFVLGGSEYTVKHLTSEGPGGLSYRAGEDQGVRRVSFLVTGPDGADQELNLPMHPAGKISLRREMWHQQPLRFALSEASLISGTEGTGVAAEEDKFHAMHMAAMKHRNTGEGAEELRAFTLADLKLAERHAERHKRKRKVLAKWRHLKKEFDLVRSPAIAKPAKQKAGASEKIVAERPQPKDAAQVEQRIEELKGELAKVKARETILRRMAPFFKPVSRKSQRMVEAVRIIRTLSK